MIDVVPIESSDSSDSQILVAKSLNTSPNGQNQDGQQVTAQVAVVQAQGSPNGQHFITVSGKLCEYQVIDNKANTFLFRTPFTA